MYQGKENLEDTFGDENPLQDSASFEITLTRVSKQAKVSKAVSYTHLHKARRHKRG